MGTKENINVKEILENYMEALDSDDDPVVQLSDQYNIIRKEKVKKQTAYQRNLRIIHTVDGDYTLDSLKNIRSRIIFRSLCEKIPLDETNKQLESINSRDLYPRNPLEACAIFCLSHNKSMEDFQRLYSEITKLGYNPVQNSEKKITLRYLRKIIDENTTRQSGLVRLTNAATAELNCGLIKCRDEKEFLDYYKSDVKDCLSNIANLQLYYVSSFMYYLIRTIIGEILSLKRDMEEEGEIFRTVEKIRKIDGIKEKNVYALNLRLEESGLYNSKKITIQNLLRVIEESGLTNDTKTLMTMACNKLIGTEPEINKAQTEDDFADMEIKVNPVLNAVYSRVLEIKEQNYGNEIRKFLRQESILQRNSFTGFLCLSSMYIHDVDETVIVNKNHQLWNEPEKKINKILNRCHYGRLDTGNNLTDALASICLSGKYNNEHIDEILFETLNDPFKMDRFRIASESKKNSKELNDIFYSQVCDYLN